MGGFIFLCVIVGFLGTICIIASIAIATSRRKRVRITHYAGEGTVLGTWVATGNYHVSSNGRQISFELPEKLDEIVITGDFRVEPIEAENK
jgi:hypothetical protein